MVVISQQCNGYKIKVEERILITEYKVKHDGLHFKLKSKIINVKGQLKSQTTFLIQMS